MATEGSVETLEDKLSELNVKNTESEVPEQFEDSTDAPVEETPEEVHASVVEEIKEGLPELHHVETQDTTNPVKEDSTEGDVVKAEVPEAFAEELKDDHDIVPTETTSEVETVEKEVAPEDSVTAPPVTETQPQSKISALGEKITQKLHNLTGKD